MIKVLIGGSPCTNWSIAQKNNRETTAEGIGWELFRNYLIAKEKFKPDFFLYENNKSAAQAIKDQISLELGVPLQYINSALVSAQNRQRFYAHNIPNVPQPEDRGILLRDILESGIVDREKAHCLKHQAGNSRDYFKKHHTQIAFEPVPFGENAEGKAHCLDACYWKGSSPEHSLDKSVRTLVAEPVCVAQRGVYSDTMSRAVKTDAPIIQMYEPREDGKTNTLTTVQKDNMVACPVRIGQFNKGGQGDRIYSIDGKSVCLSANGGGRGAKTGLYACPVEFEEIFDSDVVKNKYIEFAEKHGYIPELFNPYNLAEIKDKTPTQTANCDRINASSTVLKFEHSDKPIYEVRNGLITIKGKQYPIKLVDGYYIIRKLTVTECCRLQTMPDNYMRAVSATQGYKGLGNGWTAEVIIHILKHANIPLDEEIVVLSMYDGIGTGRYCFDKMGYSNIKYYAYEIDKYAMQVAQSNYSDIMQCGDAFQVREENWQLKEAQN